MQIDTDEQYMREALILARQGRGRTSPNPVVGAVIVKDKVIIGRGWHQKAGTAHAEIHAINDAGLATKNATLYVTLEPCVMCASALLHARVPRVVFAAYDKNWGAFGSLFDLACDPRLNHEIEVVSGVMKDEAESLLKSFFKGLRPQ